MDNNGLEVANRILPLVLARGEVDVILPLQSRFATRTEEYDEPTLSVCEAKAWALSGELFAELTLRQEIYYVSGETGLVEKDVSLHRLSQLFNVPGIEPGNLVEISAEAVPQGNWRVSGSEGRSDGVTTLTGDCKVKINYVIFEQEELTFYQPGADTDATALAETMEVECFCGASQGTYDITLPVEFGVIPKTMGEISGGLFNAKATVMPGWVRLEGDVIVTVPYHDASGAEQEESFVLPVRRYLEFPEAVDGMLAVFSSRVEIFTCRRKPDSKNGQIRGLLHADVSFSKVEALEVATGMRSHSFPGHHSGHSKKPFLLEEVIAVGSSQTLIQREIVFPRPVRKVREPVDAVVRNLTHEIIGNKVIVRGVLRKQLYAVDAETGAVFAVDVDETFVHFVDVPGAAPGMRAHVTARVEFVSVDIRPGGETARQVTIIEIIVKVTKFIKKEVVSPLFPPVKPVFPPSAPLPHPSGTVYVVRSGDSVWKIAKMFGVSMESIISANNLQNPNLIFPGQKLIIPGR